MYTTRIDILNLESRRLDTDFYQPDAVDALHKIIRFKPLRMDEVGIVWNFGAYELCNQIRISFDDKAPVFISISDISEPFIDIAKSLRVTDYTHEILKAARVEPNDILVSIAGTIGKCGIVPSHSFRGASANQALVKFRPARVDNYYALAYFTSNYFKLVLGREAGGAVQKNLYLNNFASLPIFILSPFAQSYIGDKVRQAERLRLRARELKKDIKSLSINEEILKATGVAQKRSTIVNSADMWPRLDSKYYDNKAMAIHKACQMNGTVLKDLVIGMSNGFEERTFIDKGRVYVTVSEVSSGRLNIENAPMIDHSVSVPKKAVVHERCVLVVRTGSIGNAVKVFHEDTGVSISSHLVRLEFEDESCAASVAAFMNSEAGKILQQKISYGAVQPQIGQEELSSLSIPNTILSNGEQILKLENAKELNIRSSNRLSIAAKLLVEALIEGQITESDLIAAQKALEAGDRGPDRTILSRLTRKGMDVPGEPPLFPDLDRLYDALDEIDTKQEAS